MGVRFKSDQEEGEFRDTMGAQIRAQRRALKFKEKEVQKEQTQKVSYGRKKSKKEKKKGKGIFKEKMLKAPKAKIKGISAIQALTPDRPIQVVRSAEQVPQREFEGERSLFFKEEFMKERKNLGRTHDF